MLFVGRDSCGTNCQTIALSLVSSPMSNPDVTKSVKTYAKMCKEHSTVASKRGYTDFRKPVHVNYLWAVQVSDI